MTNYCLIITAGPEQEIHPDFSFTLIGELGLVLLQHERVDGWVDAHTR